jgi:hypothetical protein
MCCRVVVNGLQQRCGTGKVIDLVLISRDDLVAARVSVLDKCSGDQGLIFRIRNRNARNEFLRHFMLPFSIWSVVT